MPEDAQETKDVQKPKAKLPIKTIMVVLGVILLEAGTISFFIVAKGGTPDSAQGGTDPIEQTRELPNKTLAEVVLTQETSVDNYIGGKFKMIVTLQVAAKVETADKENLDKRVTEHGNEILNSVRIVISSASPEEIKDPKLQVIKRQLKSEIEDVVGKDIIKEILLPIWSSYTSD